MRIYALNRLTGIKNTTQDQQRIERPLKRIIDQTYAAESRPIAPLAEPTEISYRFFCRVVALLILILGFSNNSNAHSDPYSLNRGMSRTITIAKSELYTIKSNFIRNSVLEQLKMVRT